MVCLIIVTLFAIVVCQAQGFSVTTKANARANISLFASSLGQSQERIIADKLNREEEVLWDRHLQSKEIQDVRRDLVCKITQAGKSRQEAEHEVDVFLHDREKAQPFLEMRHNAHVSNFDELDAFLWLQLFGVFMVGVMLVSAPQYYDMYKAAFPNGSGPIPWL